MKTYYQIDGENQLVSTLAEAKHHVYSAYTQRERKMYLRDCSIIKVVNEEIATITPIIITDDSYRFGRTKKY